MGRVVSSAGARTQTVGCASDPNTQDSKCIRRAWLTSKAAVAFDSSCRRSRAGTIFRLSVALGTGADGTFRHCQKRMYIIKSLEDRPYAPGTSSIRFVGSKLQEHRQRVSIIPVLPRVLGSASASTPCTVSRKPCISLRFAEPEFLLCHCPCVSVASELSASCICPLSSGASLRC